MWASCRFRKKKSTMEEKIQKIKEELEAKYEKEIAERKEECEQLKEKVKRLKRHIRKMKKAYEGQKELQISEEKNQEKSNLNLIYTANDEIWNDSIVETMDYPSELQTDMSYEFCALSPVSTETNSIEKQGTNFCREAAVGILYNIPMLRDAVLNHTEADQRQGELQILYDVFSQMGHPPHLPNSEILQKLAAQNSLLGYIGVFLNHILYKVPHLPTKALKKLDLDKNAMESLKSSRRSLVQCIMFKVRNWVQCNCNKPTVNVLEHFAFNFDQTLNQYYGSLLALNEDSPFSCSKCSAKCAKMAILYDSPDYGHFTGEKFKSEFVWKFMHYCSLTAAVFENKATGEFCYVTRKKSAFWVFTKNGVNLLDNKQKVVDLFNDPSLSLGIVQYEKLQLLDLDVLNVIRKLEDPPARFKNSWGDCTAITVSNTLLCLPKKLRRRLKELEVPKGELPHPDCIALLWEFIDGSEKVVAKQKENGWRSLSPYPERISSLFVKLGIQSVLWANKYCGCRMVDTNGVTTLDAFEALFARHAHSDAFNAFASYSVLKKGEKLEKSHFDAKELNIVVFERKLNVSLAKVLFWRPKNSLLLVAIRAEGHVYLVVIRPLGDVIVVNDHLISYERVISDSMKAEKVNAVICVPNQTDA